MRTRVVGSSGLGASLLFSAMVGCYSVPKGPLPTMPLAERSDDEQDTEFTASAEVTLSVQRFGVRRPPMVEVVDAQVRAMVAYVQKHGRGAVDPSGLPFAHSQDTDLTWINRANRLSAIATQLFGYLDLDSAPRELGQVALQALAEKLGDDAAYRPLEADDSVATADVVPVMREGIGLLRIPSLEGKSVEHALAILAQWAASEPPVRAVVLDLARCRDGDQWNAATLVNVFAPGKSALSSDAREFNTRRVERREWHGQTDWSAALYTRIPLFVVTSARTEPLSEAVAHALRHHRSARVLGGVTKGTGRMMRWQPLPWRISFGFTVADLMGPTGTPLRGDPVIPDACRRETSFLDVPERTVTAYQERCGTADVEIPEEAVLDYVRGLFPVEKTPATRAGKATSKGGK